MTEIHRTTDGMTDEQLVANVRRRLERIAEDSCTWGRARGWKGRWEWRGDSMWLIDETQQPPTATEMFDIVSMSEALRDLEAEGNG